MNCYTLRTPKLINLNFKSLEVVFRFRDPQLQVTKKLVCSTCVDHVDEYSCDDSDIIFVHMLMTKSHHNKATQALHIDGSCRKKYMVISIPGRNNFILIETNGQKNQFDSFCIHFTNHL